MKVCLGISTYKKAWPENVKSKSDRTILEDISNKNGWYDHSRSDYRLYMRLLKQEAHRRGLGS